jgi:prophage antirepressor-like protein
MAIHNLIPFTFEKHTLSVITHDSGDPWFIASEVCAALELDNVSKAVSRLDADEKESITLSNAFHSELKTLIVNESGLYNLILGSRKKSAKEFKRWVTHEVLPKIRKTGQYAVTAHSSVPDTWDVLAQIVEAGRQQAREIAALKEGQETQAAEIAELRAERPPVGKYSCVDWLRRYGKPHLPDTMFSNFKAACKRRELPERFRPASSQYEQLYYRPATLEDAYAEIMKQMILFPGQERRRG